jgi:hypothetical protein
MQVKTNNIPHILVVGVLILILAGGLFARRDPGQMNIAKPFADPVGRTLSNIGNWSYWIYNTGTSGNDPNGDPGGVYPRGTAALVFTDGLVWGGYVRDAKTENPRVGGVTYTEGIQQGWITKPGDGTNPPEAISPNDERAGMWRMRADYYQLTLEDVRQDAAELNLVDPENASESMMQDVLDEYKYAFENWPTDLGAPYYDVNGNGVYDKPTEYWVQETDPADANNTIWVWKGVQVDLDGNGEITTGEREEPGLAGADQVLYSVNNDLDEGKSIGLYGAQPMGIELQSTTWAYNQPSATLGQLIFRKYLFINKSGVDIDSMFVCQWSDADIGNYTDDYAGCDTVRSVGYGYSGFVTDPDYTNFNLPPGAIGYDFFQGPMVPGAPEDTAIFGLKKRPGFKNMPMTSYFFFASGSAISDPPLGDYDGTLEFYNMLNGYLPTIDLTNPSPYIAGSGPTAGTATKFPLAGDPTTQQGDVDGLGTNLQPGDRRIGMCSGPFWMTPGDSQEVVVAIIGGIVAQAGGDNRNAVLQMKLNSDFAQFIYDNLFQAIPRAPVPPKVIATPMEDHIALNWGSDLNAVTATEANDPILGFNFEGYNIYQLPTATATVEQAKKIATYDVVNNVTTIYATKFVGSIGDIVTIPVQKGTDTGIKRHFILDQDYINGKPLAAGNTYYFAVTAYNFNEDPTVPEPSLESSLLPAITVVPQGTVPGTRYEGSAGDVVATEHTSGAGEGQILVTVIDPAATTGHEYEIFFVEDTDTNSATFGKLLWNVRDKNTGEIKVSNQIQRETLEETETQPIFDGLQVKVTGPELTYTSFQVVQNAAGVLDPPDIGCFAFNNNGFPFWMGADRPDGDRQQTDGSTWGIHTGTTGAAGQDQFSYFITRTTQGGARWSEISPYDWEIRFTYEADNYGLEPGAFSGAGNVLMTVPFELWNIGIGTPDDPSDDWRLFPYLIDSEADGIFNLAPIDHAVSGGTNDPETDWFYWVIPSDRSPGEGGYNTLLSAIQADVPGYVYLAGTDGDAIRRMVLVNWNGGDALDPTFPANMDSEMPEQGTVFRITSAKPNATDDVHTFTAPAVTKEDAVAAQDVEKINVFPNPYYASNPSEPDRFTRFVTFNHLPQQATIRIFNLAGVQVRKIEKDTPGQFQTWDLQNEAGIPVASGMYIAHIDMPKLGKEKVLKLMIIQAQEQLKYY